MKVFLLYRPDSEHERAVEEFVHDFTRETGKSLELVNVDSVEGTQKAELYGVVSLPAVIAVTDNGVMQQIWQGGLLPTISEVSYYAKDS